MTPRGSRKTRCPSLEPWGSDTEGENSSSDEDTAVLAIDLPSNSEEDLDSAILGTSPARR